MLDGMFGCSSLGLYEHIPYSKTAAFFNRDGSSIAKDALAFDQELRHPSKTR